VALSVCKETINIPTVSDPRCELLPFHQYQVQENLSGHFRLQKRANVSWEKANRRIALCTTPGRRATAREALALTRGLPRQPLFCSWTGTRSQSSTSPGAHGLVAIPGLEPDNITNHELGLEETSGGIGRIKWTGAIYQEDWKTHRSIVAVIGLIGKRHPHRWHYRVRGTETRSWRASRRAHL